MIQSYESKELCCGCTACLHACPSQAIAMEEDVEGFLYPVIAQDRCTDCGLCKDVCDFGQQGGQGPAAPRPMVYAVRHRSDAVRVASSSGGMFTALSDAVLTRGGVVYGAAFDQTLRVCHQRALTSTERNRFRGSKYVQSYLGDTFHYVRQDLLAGKEVLFSGTPCQVAGLTQYLKGTNTARLLAVDLVCHGVPSPRLFADFIQYCEQRRKTPIMDYSCRCKVHGWHQHIEEIAFASGKRDHSSSLSQVYKQLFSSYLALRPACHRCKYASVDRPSDLTLGDFWGIERWMPELDDDKGTSLVLVNSERGMGALTELAGCIEAILCVTNHYLQPMLQAPYPEPRERQQFWACYRERGFAYISRKYTQYGWRKRIVGQVKGMIPVTVKSLMKCLLSCVVQGYRSVHE